MIKQGEELWTPEDGRERRWHAYFFGGPVVLRKELVVPVDGDYPETWELTWAEWEDMHADYGLNIDGTPLEGVPL